MAGYLTANGIESAIIYIAGAYPAIATAMVLPEKSHEGRTIRALRVTKGGTGKRRGVLLVGGMHAREVVNPDALVQLASRLCQAYTSNSGLTFGGKTYSASTVKLIIEAMELFFLPLANPDGRAYVQNPTGDAMWRKNRNPNPGQACKGVDLNRNFDFLWSSGIGTSVSACSDTYKGSAAMSEPETRNIQGVLDANAHIQFFVDVHSYSELILYPWGDDDSQTVNPAMDFRNHAYDGMRGTTGDSVYREYIGQSDLDWYVSSCTRVRDAIATVRGRVYTVEPSVGLYPTSATSDDYVHSRHIVSAAKPKVRAITIETGREFQPPYAEGQQVMDEVCAGLIEFSLAGMCAPTAVAHAAALTDELDVLRALRDLAQAKPPHGPRYVALLDQFGGELVNLLLQDQRLMDSAKAAMEALVEPVRTARTRKPKPITDAALKVVGQIIGLLKKQGGTKFRSALVEAERDLPRFRNKGILQGFEALAKARPAPTPA